MKRTIRLFLVAGVAMGLISCATKPPPPPQSATVQVVWPGAQKPVVKATVYSWRYHKPPLFPLGMYADFSVPEKVTTTHDGSACLKELLPNDTVQARSSDGRFLGGEPFIPGQANYRITLDSSSGYSLRHGGDDSHCDKLLNHKNFSLQVVLDYHAKYPDAPYLSFSDYLKKGVISLQQFNATEKAIHCFGKSDSYAEIIWGSYIIKVNGMSDAIRLEKSDERPLLFP